MREAIESLELVQNLKKIDRWLLVNRPGLWVIRLPYLLVYAVSANLSVYLIIQALPLQLHHVGSLFPILWVIFLACLGAFIFWVTRFNRHSAERAFENTSPLKGLSDFVIYLVCILALLSPSITASFALTKQFDNMISLEDVREDARIEDGYKWDEKLPEGLVEKYTGLDSQARKGMSNRDINRIVRFNLRSLEDIKENTFVDLWLFFTPHLIVSHFALVMFAAKHTKRSTVYRTIAYGVGLFILLMIFLLILELLQGSPTFLGRLIDDWRDAERIWLWGCYTVLGIMTLIASSVFRLKRYREFVAMNIAILPVGVYFFLTFEILDYLYDHKINKHLSNIEEIQLNMLILSPLIYLWLIPVLKAMYMRLLALPREG